MNKSHLLENNSFIELNARNRAKSILDKDTMRELIGPFDNIKSPWLAQQGIVAQADDGVVVAKGTIDSQPAVVIAIEGGFQGGSLGEVSGAKMAGAIELAAEDNRNNIPTRVVLLLETGGVRLQEANLGLAAIAEIHSAISDLRRYQPVIAIVAGTVGCFGGMSVAAALCSYLIVTQDARVGLNGPQVIEQEAGVAEYDSRNRPFIWSLSGGEQRFHAGLADCYVEDNADEIYKTVRTLFKQGKPKKYRDEEITKFLDVLNKIDTSHPAMAADVRKLLNGGK